MKKLLFLGASIAALLASPALAQTTSNTSYVGQTSNSNLVSVEQIGGAQGSSIVLQGLSADPDSGHNAAAVRQSSLAPGGAGMNHVYIEQISSPMNPGFAVAQQAAGSPGHVAADAVLALEPLLADYRQLAAVEQVHAGSGDANSATILQGLAEAGAGNRAVIAQNGSGADGFIAQNGSDNTALIRQGNATDAVTGDMLSLIAQSGTGNIAANVQGAGADSLIEQSGTMNEAYVAQVAALETGGRSSTVRQDGTGNLATVTQDAPAAGSTVLQGIDALLAAIDNEAAVSQSADAAGSISHIEQAGVGNQAAVVQDAAAVESYIVQSSIALGNIAGVEQVGAGAYSEIAQIGSGNQAEIVQAASGGRSFVSQGLLELSADNSAEVSQLAGALGTISVIEQDGFGNTALVNQAAAGADSFVSQLGSGNMVTVNQLTGANSVSAVNQTGTGNVATVSQ